MKKLFTIAFVLLLSVGISNTAFAESMKVSTLYFEEGLSKNEIAAKVKEIQNKYAHVSIKDQIKQGTLLSPDEGCVVFGFGYCYAECFQQNPEIGYRFHKAEICRGNILSYKKAYAFEPLPLKSKFKMFYGVIESEYEVTSEYYGIDGVDIVLDKPGLYYLGSCDPDRSKEAKALKAIKSIYAKTAWEPIIDARLKELNDE